MTELAIDVSGITKSFAGRVVVDNLALKVRKGEVFGFLGPNGSGKTTFIRILCGLLRPDAGSGQVLGLDVRADTNQIKHRVGYMTQKFSFYEDMSVEENLTFVAKVYEILDINTAVENTLTKFGLSDRRDQLTGQLSGGWKQRVALAACLIHSPDLLLLDEPTAGVDPKARRDFWDQIHALTATGITVLVTTHYMDEAERCSRIAYLTEGRLLTMGTVDEVVSRAKLFTYEVTAPNLQAVALALTKNTQIDSIAFGNSLHVSSASESEIIQALSSSMLKGVSSQKIPTTLEDVFIHLMQHNGGKNADR